MFVVFSFLLGVKKKEAGRVLHVLNGLGVFMSCCLARP